MAEHSVQRENLCEPAGELKKEKSSQVFFEGEVAERRRIGPPGPLNAI
jgi:hypothetical protein